MDIIVPQVGESIVEAEIGEWFKKDGEYVNKDDLLLELETEKVNVELNAEASGKLTILSGQGETIKIGAVIGKIDETATASPSASRNRRCRICSYCDNRSCTDESGSAENSCGTGC